MDHPYLPLLVTFGIAAVVVFVIADGGQQSWPEVH